MAKSIAQHMENINHNPDGNPNIYQEIINRLIDVMSADHDVYVGETPPTNPEPGDIWYKPSEDRYYHRVS